MVATNLISNFRTDRTLAQCCVGKEAHKRIVNNINTSSPYHNFLVIDRVNTLRLDKKKVLNVANTIALLNGVEGVIGPPCNLPYANDEDSFAVRVALGEIAYLSVYECRSKRAYDKVFAKLSPVKITDDQYLPYTVVVLRDERKTFNPLDVHLPLKRRIEGWENIMSQEERRALLVLLADIGEDRYVDDKAEEET